MTSHAMLASATLVTAGLAALNALVHAWVRPARPLTRWSLLVLSVAAMVLVIATGEVGGPLLEDVKASGSAAEIDAAQEHAHGTNALAVSVFGLLVTVLATIWKALHPRRGRWTTGMWIGAVLLTVFAVATLVTGGLVLAAGLDAAAIGNDN